MKMNWFEIVDKAMEDYTASTGKVIDEYDLNDLNDYLKIVFDAYEFYGMYPEDLECICDSLQKFFLFDEKYAINDKYNDDLGDYDFEKYFPDKNLNFALGLIIVSIFNSMYTSYHFTKDDLPTVRACLDTPYEKRKEAKEKTKLYFWSKERCNRTFFIEFFDCIYELWWKPEESLVICSYNYGEKKNIKLKDDLKKLFDIVINAKLVKTAIPYGRIYEVFQNDKWLFTVINEIGNNRDESEKRIYDCHILTEDAELREFLELFLNVKVSINHSKDFNVYEKYVYGNMNMANGSKINEYEKLLSINSEIFASIRVIGGWWED